jgi:hypothetical protein
VGYPGSPEYREFYRDLGWDAEYEYIKPYVMPNGQRKNVGIKYHKITGKGLGLSEKSGMTPIGRGKKPLTTLPTSCTTGSSKSATCTA